MSNNDSKLSPAFVAQQQERLEALRDQILRDTSAAADEQRELGQRHNEVQDSGDEGAIEADRHAADAISAGAARRLPEILRALEKIAEGSYGLSDDSGAPTDLLSVPNGGCAPLIRPTCGSTIRRHAPAEVWT